VFSGLLFAVFVLSKRLRISDEIIGALSTVSQTLAALFYAFAYNEFLFYVGERARGATRFVILRSPFIRDVFFFFFLFVF